MKLLLCVCSVVSAFVALPAAAQGITYDCDTAASHFSELDIPVTAAAFTVSGNVRLKTTAVSEAWVPATRIRIASVAAEGHLPDRYAGFTISADKASDSEPVVQMLSYQVNGTDDGESELTPLGKPGTVQPFVLAYDGKVVSVTVGTDTKRFPVAAPAPVVQIICSTGEFLFTDLVITPQH
jgi:hypothetical protein